MSIVICRLPRAGLGNQLFPLMKAHTFAHLNKLPIIVTNYHQVKIGPWLRRDKTRRNYSGFFTFQKNLLAAQLDNLNLKRYKKNVKVNEPLLRVYEKQNDIEQSFCFSAIPHYTTYFKELNENRQLVVELFWKLISESIRKKISRLSSPSIGIHIRMGDFRNLKAGEEFGKAGTVRTPEDYFIDTINSIRKMHGSDLSVSVFTDGLKRQFQNLFKLNNINLIEGNCDLEDLILLSKSKIIITSAGSTFSYWAAFLSEAPVIMHPTYVNISLRPDDVNEKLFYGAFDSNNRQLINLIKMI